MRNFISSFLLFHLWLLQNTTEVRLLIKLAEFLAYGVIGDHNYLFTLCACMFCLHRTCTSYVHEKGLSFLETEATSHRKPPVAVGNLARILWKNSWCPSEPSFQLPRSWLPHSILKCGKKRYYIYIYMVLRFWYKRGLSVCGVWWEGWVKLQCSFTLVGTMSWRFLRWGLKSQ